MKNTQLIAVVILVVGLAVGFFGGIQYEKTKAPQAQTTTRSRGQFFTRTGGANGGAAMGQIISAGNNTLTVQLQDGSSKVILLSGNTAINKTASASATDLQNGERVAVFGTANSDGSITAQNIQINPVIFRGGPGGGGNGG